MEILYKRAFVHRGWLSVQMFVRWLVEAVVVAQQSATLHADEEAVVARIERDHRDLGLLAKVREHAQRKNLVGLLVRERVRGWADDASLPVGDELFGELLQLLSPPSEESRDA